MHPTLPCDDSATQLEIQRFPLVAPTRTVERFPEDETMGLFQLDASALVPPSWLTRLPDSRAPGFRCLPRRTQFAKRLLDVVVAATLLTASLPLMACAAIAIKLTSPGPILFAQTRVGLNSRRRPSRRQSSRDHRLDGQDRRQTPSYGRPFTIYKLRTMTVEEKQTNGPIQTIAGDRRVTSVGRILRDMRIDELPQLVNVLRGEMSMVGPRPECIEYMDELSAKIPDYAERLGIKPGLTGIAQIEVGYVNTLDSYRLKVAFDLLYLQNCCTWNDIKILLRTIRVVLTGAGAM